MVSTTTCQLPPSLSLLSMYLLGDTEAQLSRYLLRTLCSDLTNTVLIYLAEDIGVDTPSHGQGEMTAKVGRVACV